MLRRTWPYMQSHQSLHCSRTCTKWAYIWHIPSVNAQTRLSIHAVSPEPSLLSNMHINGRIYDIIFQPMLRLEVACMKSCQNLYCSRTCTKNGCVYAIFYQSMLRQDLVCVQSRQSSHCSSPLHKMGVHMVYSFSECSYAPEHWRSLIRPFAARTLTKRM